MKAILLVLALLAGCASGDGDPANVVEKPDHVSYLESVKPTAEHYGPR